MPGGCHTARVSMVSTGRNEFSEVLLARRSMATILRGRRLASRQGSGRVSGFGPDLWLRDLSQAIS